MMEPCKSCEHNLGEKCNLSRCKLEGESNVFKRQIVALQQETLKMINTITLADALAKAVKELCCPICEERFGLGSCTVCESLLAYNKDKKEREQKEES